LDTGFVAHLNISLGYRATANLHTLQFTTAPAKPFPACCVLTSCSLATASNSGDSSASRAQVLPSPTLVQNCLPAIPSNDLDRHLFSASLAELNCTQHSTNSQLSFQSESNQLVWFPRHIASGRTQQKTPFPIIPLLFLAYSLRGNLFNESLPSNGRLI
jgi:hypothetical protein